MNILDNIYPSHILAVILIIYLIISLLSFAKGIRKFSVKLKNNPNITSYLKGEISNPGFPKLLLKRTFTKRKSSKKEINIFNK